MQKYCENCKNYEKSIFESPCNVCRHNFGQSDKWEPTNKTNFGKITASPETLAEYMCLNEWRMEEYQECVNWLEEEAEEGRDGVL